MRIGFVVGKLGPRGKIPRNLGFHLFLRNPEYVKGKGLPLKEKPFIRMGKEDSTS